MAWKPNPIQHKSSQVFLSLVLLGVLFVVLGVALIINSQVEKSAPSSTIGQPAPTTEVPATDIDEPAAEPEPEGFDAVAMQLALDNWVAGQSGIASVVIADPQAANYPAAGSLLAAHNIDEQYFTASIYKLFVAYEGYRAVDAGELDPTQAYLGDATLATCLDLMIRESDSPCAEKLWNQLGKQQLTDRLAEYGLTSTDLVGLQTTASDVAIILQKIALGEGLSTESQQALLESMQNQIYRDALNKGFSQDVTVYNKIGFNGVAEYHDTAIIQLPDGRQIIFVVLTDGVGTSQIANLARAIEQILVQ